MKTDIILAGVGGQGILSIAAAIGHAALKNNLFVKQAETHGMSQRGGDVVSHLRISNQEIYSDLIPKGKADLIIAVEPMEGLRYVPYLSKEGYLITNTTPFKNVNNYPELKDLFNQIEQVHNLVKIDADEIASSLKSKRSSNMVMLGASAPFFNDITFNVLQDGIREMFEKKGTSIVEANIKAMESGRNETAKILNAK